MECRVTVGLIIFYFIKTFCLHATFQHFQPSTIITHFVDDQAISHPHLVAVESKKSKNKKWVDTGDGVQKPNYWSTFFICLKTYLSQCHVTLGAGRIIFMHCRQYARPTGTAPPASPPAPPTAWWPSPAWPPTATRGSTLTVSKYFYQTENTFATLNIFAV